MNEKLLLWDIYWAPEGRVIATVRASDAEKAKRMTPRPYKKYIGEVYVQLANTKGEPATS